jgi:hypothetical protein
MELAKLGVVDKIESKVSMVDRENLELTEAVERIRNQNAIQAAEADALRAALVAQASKNANSFSHIASNTARVDSGRASGSTDTIDFSISTNSGFTPGSFTSRPESTAFNNIRAGHVGSNGCFSVSTKYVRRPNE